MWAHAEYIKLLRSVADGKVFDRISVVEERYGVRQEDRKFLSRMEIFQLGRPISAMMQGGTLRVFDAQPFQLTWTLDDWATTKKTSSTQVAPAGSFVDISVAPDATGKVSFTMFWPDRDGWLGRNAEVTINAAATPATEPENVKPKS